MLNLFSLFPMEQVVSLLKYVSAILVVVAPAFKVLHGRARDPVRELEERDKRIQAFFDAGGVELSPLRMESSFGAALGHTRLSAPEIRLIVYQHKPTSFVASYLPVRGYIAPSEDGRRFILKSVAAYPKIRLVLSVGGIALYGAFCFSSIWLAFYLGPKMAIAGAWKDFALTLVLAVMFALAGGYFLVAAGHLNVAKRLHDAQSEA